MTPASNAPRAASSSANALDWRGFFFSIATVALATAIGWPLVHSRLQLPNVDVLMLYLLSVLWVATHHSRAAAILASVLGVATFDFLFVQPYYTFAVADRQYLITFATMLLTALVISTMTHRARFQSELARQAWEHVETEFLRNTLLSGVSHDLRTPLAAITGAATTLIESNNTLSREITSDLLETIYSESERMERLINNLLDMTRMEAGGMILKREWLPLQEVVGSALQRLDRRLKNRPVKTDLPPNLPLLHIDGLLIEQVLVNLIDNAIEYTPADSPIELSASLEDRLISVQIADSGPGLPAGTEDRVFEKFFRIRPIESRRGIGLGLTIVRGIINAHGGEILATNRPEGGAIFRFILPLTETPPAMDSSA